jgi:uncharacterized UPF0146 family protein
VRTETAEAIAEKLAGYDAVVEVGIGRRPDVAAALASRGVAVTATDVSACEVPVDVRFVRDDVTDPDRSVYAGAGAVYGLNLPPELHRPMLDVAQSVDAACLFTTLGGDPPTVPVEREPVPGDTVYVARRQE